MLLSRFCTSILFVVLACPVAANADYLIDDFSSATPHYSDTSVSAPVSDGDLTASRIIDNLFETGYTFVYSGLGNETRTASVTYTFSAGLYANIIGGSDADDIVSFYVPFWRMGGDDVGTFTVKAYIIEAGTPTNFFTQVLDNVASNQTDPYEMFTTRTLGDLATTDIDGLRFDVTYSAGGENTNNQTLRFGGTGNGASNGGLYAVPEPTSVMMFGSIIGGLLFRRRRN